MLFPLLSQIGARSFMSGPLLIGLLFFAVLFIIYGTAYLRLHPFLVLLVSAYGLGLASGLSQEAVLEAVTGGFGDTIGYIGIVIAAGTIIGTLLERSGGAVAMASALLRWIGKKRADLAMSATGALISIPVFCDSGYVVLSPLNRSVASETGGSMATFAVALSMGLYTTHVFVPPTPGPIAAAGELGADVGTVIIFGSLVTLPVLLATLLFARYMGSRVLIDPTATVREETKGEDCDSLPPEQRLRAWQAFLPVLVPVLLIALQSVANLPGAPFGKGSLAAALRFAGNPNTALLFGAFLALAFVGHHGPRVYGAWIGDGLREAGLIILITGAGGALGRVLQATAIGDYLGNTLATLNLGAFGILLPFLMAAALKTTQGSSTVAIITSASIAQPLLDSLGLSTDIGLVLTTLAIGAGAMTVSHANDSYFWVVSQFSGMSVSQAYRLHTVGSAVAGTTGIVVILILRAMLL